MAGGVEHSSVSGAATASATGAAALDALIQLLQHARLAQVAFAAAKRVIHRYSVAMRYLVAVILALVTTNIGRSIDC